MFIEKMFVCILIQNITSLIDLQNDIEKLKQANSNLMHVLKESEGSFMELQEQVITLFLMVL